MKISDDLAKVMQILKEVNLKELERSEELGRDYSFKPAVDIIRLILNDLDRVIENAASIRVSESVEERVKKLAVRTGEYVQKIKSFILKGNEGNASSQHQEIINGLERLYQEDLDFLPPLIERAEILRLKPSDVEQQVAAAMKSIKEIDLIQIFPRALPWGSAADSVKTSGFHIESVHERPERVPPCI